MTSLRIEIILFIVILLVATVFGQGFYFGRNKVQYNEFDWHILKTEHFDIYYYPEMKNVAEKGAYFAEESYNLLQTKFNHTIKRRIPLIFYSSHLHFQQTNITPGFIPEGVGGFFEFLKGRVVIPSNGNLNQFKRCLVHRRLEFLVARPVAIGLLNDNVPLQQQPLKNLAHVQLGIVSFLGAECHVFKIAEHRHNPGFIFTVHSCTP